MNHDPEQLAAAYLTTMRPRARRRFESHLLACEPCWQEVCLGCRGRQLAQTARDLAPAQLREDIRAAVEATATHPGASPRPFRPATAAAAIALERHLASQTTPAPHHRAAGQQGQAQITPFGSSKSANRHGQEAVQNGGSTCDLSPDSRHQASACGARGRCDHISRDRFPDWLCGLSRRRPGRRSRPEGVTALDGRSSERL
jgi:hypothetical protein